VCLDFIYIYIYMHTRMWLLFRTSTFETKKKRSVKIKVRMVRKNNTICTHMKRGVVYVLYVCVCNPVPPRSFCSSYVPFCCERGFFSVIRVSRANACPEAFLYIYISFSLSVLYFTVAGPLDTVTE